MRNKTINTNERNFEDNMPVMNKTPSFIADNEVRNIHDIKKATIISTAAVITKNSAVAKSLFKNFS